MATLVVQTEQPAARNGVTIVMRGLENPRGMAIGPEGALYVAEAGKGGPEGPTNCQVLRGLKRCFGLTGALTRVWRGKQERVAIRLPSVTDLTANPEVGGPNDVSFLGRGGTFLTIGLGGDPTTGVARPTARCQPWPCCHGPWADRPEQSTPCQRPSRWDQTARITSGC